MSQPRTIILLAIFIFAMAFLVPNSQAQYPGDFGDSIPTIELTQDTGSGSASGSSSSTPVSTSKKTNSRSINITQIVSGGDTVVDLKY